jgi:IclR family pca regulon transcriptional regulator
MFFAFVKLTCYDYDVNHVEGSAIRMMSPKAPAKTAAANTKSSVQSLAKAFRALEAIAASESDLTLSEIAAAADLDPGTTHRMLNTLVGLGYVERTEAKRFTLTLKVLDLGFRAIGHRDLRTLARPLLRSLVGEVSEAASLGVLNGADVLYVERMRAGLTRLGVDIRMGTVIPVTSSVIGWAMLAFLPEAELKRVLQAQKLAEMPADLARQIKTIRKQGYALSASKISNGLCVLAMPVRDKDGYPVAAVSVAAPSMRMSLTELEARALAPLRKVAGQIALGLEASGGTVAG